MIRHSKFIITTGHSKFTKYGYFDYDNIARIYNYIDRLY